MRLVHCARIGLCLLAMAGALSGRAGAETLYGSAFSGPDGLADLHTIDPSTGSPTLVGPIKFQRVSAMDFGPDGRLYGVGERNDGTDTVVLIVIDTATGLGTEVAPLGGVGANRPVTDISFRPSDGRLYAFFDGPDEVGVIDHASGAVTFLGFPGTSGGGNGIAFSKNVTLYHVESGLSSLNQTTGAATLVGPLAYLGFPPLGGPRINAMDTQPSKGVIYTSVNDASSGGPRYLATMDPVSLTVNHIGLSVNGLDGLAWEPTRCRAALYGAAHSGGSAAPSRFLRIDPLTGVATVIGGINFNSVGGIDVHPQTGRIFGIGKRPSDGTNVLIAIDPVTGAGTEIGPLVNAGIPGFGGLFDLSFRSDGRLFLSGWDNTTPDSTLYVVDQTTGLATPIGGMGTLGPGNGMAYSLSDSLHHSNSPPGPQRLNLLDQSTGAATFQFPLTYSGFPPFGATPRLNAMDTDPSTGYVWAALNDGGGGSGPNYLSTLDPRTGLVRHVGLSAPGLDALAWAPLCDDGDPCTVDECVRCQDAELYGAAFAGQDGLADLLRIDPITGTSSVIGPIGFERVSGMDFDRETGILYATGERNDGTNTNVLIAIDPATGAGNEIGPTGLPLGLGLDVESDISIRHSDGRIYAYIEPNDGVATIDRITGAATLLGLSGISGLGNGAAFSNTDVLFHANDASANTLDQSTGAATAGPGLSFAGFPPPVNAYRVAAMDTNCNGRFFVIVKDGFGATGPAYLAVLDPASGTVGNIGPTAARMDAITWTGIRGFCRNTFVDSDLDTVCDGLDCADFDPSVWASPPEITTDTFINPTDYVWGSLAPVTGPGTVYDLIADPVGALPVGPLEGLGALCGIPHMPVSTGPVPLGQIYWVAVRGRNVCALGSWGYERHNSLPPFPLIQQRTTMSCP